MTEEVLRSILAPAVVSTTDSGHNTDVDEPNKPPQMEAAVAAHQEKVMQLLQQHGIVPVYDEKQSCFSLHGSIDVDAYKIAMFKVLPCKKKYNHDWTACPYAHPNERARRRCLLICNYYAKVCPDMQNKGECPRGEDCPMTHSMFEYWMHPQRYRSKLCREGVKCSRIYCFFAHTTEELRVPCDGLFTLQPLHFNSNTSNLSATNTQTVTDTACGLSAQYDVHMQQPTLIPVVGGMQQQGISSTSTAVIPAAVRVSAVDVPYPGLTIAAATANQLVTPGLQPGLQLAGNSGSNNTHAGQGMYLSGTSDSAHGHAGSSSSSSSTCTNSTLPMSFVTATWVADGMTSLTPQQQQEQQQLTMLVSQGWQDQQLMIPQLQMVAPLQSQHQLASDAGLAAQLNQLQLQTEVPHAAAAVSSGLNILMSNPTGTLNPAFGLTTVPVMTVMPTTSTAAANFRVLQLQDNRCMLVQGQSAYVPMVNNQQLQQQQQQQQQIVPYTVWPSQ